MKKTSAAAAVVSYVNERMQEQDQASVAVNAALPGSATAMTAVLRQRSVCHPFYLLGLNPQTTTVQAVRNFFEPNCWSVGEVACVGRTCV